jgi:alginate O-acetyltransferase complex protein AlgI
MLLYTPAYLLFLLIVGAVYWVTPKFEWRKPLLLTASFGYYALFDIRFLALLALLIVVTYALGIAISRTQRPKRYLWLSLLVNLGLLAVFKYAGFFLSNLQASLDAIGFHVQSPALNLLLPVGISFYTFQAISYTVEISRKKLSPASSFVDFALYMAFFPKLIAGPIIRPKSFFDQASQPTKKLTPEMLQAGLGLLLIGLFKKMIIADSLAALADVSFRAADLPVQGFPTPLFIQGFYLYAFQIYADFSGYTDLARGSALLLGFSLPENFQQPYLASTLTSFWNRWHISLTQWFREYVFFPFSRLLMGTTKRRYQRLIQVGATLVTMLLIGFWHGASWTFVVWGLWHGSLLSIEQQLNIKPARRLAVWIGGLVTFHLAAIGWILFRSSSFAAARRFFLGLLSLEQMNLLGYYAPSVLVTAGLVLATDLVLSGRLRMPAGKLRHALVIAALVLLASLTLLNAARGADVRPFIYGVF